MIPSLIVALGLSLFPGTPDWFLLDTSGIVWSVNILDDCQVTQDDGVRKGVSGTGSEHNGMEGQ